MESIEKFYNYYVNTPSDINEHLPTIYEFSKKCSHLTEMGVRTCVSSWAMLYSNPTKMVSYDIYKHPNVHELETKSKENFIDFSFIEADVLKIEIEKTDLLFIDTWHTYSQLISELHLHSKQVKKYILLHDTVSYGYTDEGKYDRITKEVLEKIKGKEGLVSAIEDFLSSDLGKDWEIFQTYMNNNGLTVLKNKTINEN